MPDKYSDQTEGLTSDLDQAPSRIKGAVAASDELFQHILSNLPDFIFSIDTQSMQIVYANRDIFAMLGWTLDYANMTEDEISLRWRSIVHPDDYSVVLDPSALTSQLNEGETVQRVVRFMRVDESWAYYMTRCSKLVMAGESERAVVIAHDISAEIEAADKLAKQEQRYRTLAENVSDLVCALDMNFNMNFVGPSVFKILGWEPSDVMGYDDIDDHMETVAEFKTWIRAEWKAANEGVERPLLEFSCEGEVHLPDQALQLIPFLLKCTLMVGDDQQPIGFLVTGRNLQNEQRAEENERMAAKVFGSSSDGILILDDDLNIIQVNPALLNMTGYAESELLGNTPIGLLVDETVIIDSEAMLAEAERSGKWQGDGYCLRKSGEPFFALTSVAPLSSEGSNRIIFVTIRDVTESKQREERIKHLAYYDALTELPNRTLFQDRLDREMERCKRSGNTAALLFLDLDAFKAINDTLGHAAGDKVLAEAAQRLKAHVRSEDTVARMSGDEFTIIISGKGSVDHTRAAASLVAQKVQRELSEPFIIDGQDAFVSVSIGIALYPEDASSGTTLLRNADTAMYFAKQAGKNNFQFYTPNMHVQSIKQVEFHAQLRRAVDNFEFEVFYQPQYEYRSQSMRTVESLLRWRQPDGTLVSPLSFLPLAEQTGMIIRMGEWLIERSLQQFVEWRQDGIGIERLTINLSARQFGDCRLVDELERLLGKYDVAGSAIELELTESSLMADFSTTREVLLKLSELGVSIAIDDFGTGYTSLNFLKELPISTLKIDRSFVANLPGEREDQQIVKVMVGLAEGFDLRVVAEGVETREQSAYIEALGCEAAQGFLFTGPLPAWELEQFLAGRSAANDDSMSA